MSCFWLFRLLQARLFMPVTLRALTLEDHATAPITAPWRGLWENGVIPVVNARGASNQKVDITRNLNICTIRSERLWRCATHVRYYMLGNAWVGKVAYCLCRRMRTFSSPSSRMSRNRMGGAKFRSMYPCLNGSISQLNTCSTWYKTGRNVGESAGICRYNADACTLKSCDWNGHIWASEVATSMMWA